MAIYTVFLNPSWPAFVDLFAALLIASFGGFIMLTGAYQQESRFSENAAQKIMDMRNQLASFQELEPPNYPIVAIGYAYSQPFPGYDRVKPDCYDRNRRKTLRLRADTPQIESRLKQHTQSIQ